MNNLNNNYKKRFLTIFISVFLISLICILFIFFGYRVFNAQSVYDPSKQRDSTLITAQELKQQEEQSSSGIFTPPVRTNILITGVDKAENLTDVLMVASFVSTTGEINLISIPRDTYVSYKGEDLTELRNINSGAPSHMKANSIYAYTKSSGMDMLKSTVESMLGIKIDYYVKVDLDAFVSIVDSIGGVYFTVPEGGLKYTDPSQGLYINLKEGYQLLDGKSAEGLVRFRKGYATQDLQRVQVQQEFIKELISQVLNNENLISNLGEIALTTYKYVETDFGISDLPKYLGCIPSIDISKMKTTTLPGYAQTIDGLSYYVLDSSLINQIVEEYFYGNTDPNVEETTSNENIEITSTDQ